MDEELQKILKYLRLGGCWPTGTSCWPRPGEERFSHERLLQHVLEAEYRVKSENARLLRRKRAHIPELLEIETFPFARQPKLDRKRIMSLYDSFDYMTKTAEHRLAGTDRLRQDRLGHRLPAAGARSGLSRLLHHLSRVGGRTVRLAGRSFGSSRSSASTPATTAW